MLDENLIDSLIKQAQQIYNNLDIDKYFPNTKYKLALNHYKKGEYLEAKEDFEDCLVERGIYTFSAEKRASSANFLSKMHMEGKLGTVNMGLSYYYMKMAAELSEDPIHQRNMGGLLVSQGRPKEAYSYLQKCAESDYTEHFSAKSKANCLHWIGIIHTLKSSDFYNLPKAINYQTMALALDPLHDGYMNALTIATGKLNEILHEDL